MVSEGRVTIVKVANSKSNSSIVANNNDDHATNDTVIEVLK